MPLISVNIRSGDRKVGVHVDTVKTVLEFKEAIQAELNIPQERQKLIYSGRVLKDDDTVEKYGIQNGQTVHLVQTPARQPDQPGAPTAGMANNQAPPPQQQIPSNLASGAGAFNPFAGLTGARYAGQVQLPSANMFGPDPGNQVPPSPEQLGEMMQQPAFQQAMSQVLSDPRMVDYLIQSQPQLQAMGPGVRQYMQSEEFRRMMTDPNMFRNMMDMNRMFSQMGMPVPGMPAARQQTSFPAPGVTNTTQPQHQQAANRPTSGGQQAANPFEAMFPPPPQGQGVANAPNPFMALFPTAQPGVQSPFGSQTPVSSFGTAPLQPQGQQQHPQGFASQPSPLSTPQGGMGSPYSGSQQPAQQSFGQGQQPPNLQSMWSMLQSLNSMAPPGGMGQNPLAPGQAPGFLPPGLARPAPDTRPIEERYQEELRQLNDMGFTDFARNIAALRRTGGNVEAAVEMLISGTV